MTSTPRIGIDATALPPRPVGAGNYIIQLIRSLAHLQPEYELIVFAHQHGHALIETEPLPSLRWVDLPDRSVPARLAWEQVGLPRLARQHKLDLLHSLHYTRPAVLPCKSVVTFHDMTFFLFPELHTREKRVLFPLYIRYSARTTDLLIASSESTRQDSLRILDIPAERIQTVHLGVGPEFRPIQDKRLQAEVVEQYRLPERFLLFVGLVEPRKNVPLLLQAFAQAAANPHTPDLVVAGRLGWMVEEVFQQVEALGLKDRVHFPGYISQNHLPMVYNLADIFIYPSRYEGFGLPPLEAMACGTPVITTAVSSLLEHVEGAGLLVPPQDGPALADAILSLVQDEAYRKELGYKGLLRAQQYTWEHTAQKTLNIYRKVLQES